MVSAVSWRFSRKVRRGVVGFTGTESEEHFGGEVGSEREKRRRNGVKCKRFFIVGGK